MFCIELVNITFKQGTLGLNEMYLQILDNIACISREKQGNIFAPQLRSYGIVALPDKYQNVKWEGYIIAAKVKICR